MQILSSPNSFDFICQGECFHCVRPSSWAAAEALPGTAVVRLFLISRDFLPPTDVMAVKYRHLVSIHAVDESRGKESVES